MAEAGSIEISLRARVDRLEADLRKAEMATKKTSSGMKANFKSVANSLNKVKGNAVAAAAVIVGLTTGAMASLAKQAIRTANDLGDIANKLGISTSALQEFQFAANQSGVKAETLNMGLQRFGRRAAEAANGTGEAKDALKQLGVQLRDTGGNLRSTEDLFSDALNALSKVPNELERNRLAFKLFDSEGVALVNMAGNFETLREEARSLGLVLGEDVIANADNLQDRLDTLAQITSTRLAPALIDLGGAALVEAAEAMATLAGWADRVYRSFADIESLSMRQLKAQMNDLKELNKADDQRVIDAMQMGSRGQAQTIQQTIDDRLTQIEAMAERLAEVEASFANRTPPAADPTSGKIDQSGTPAERLAAEKALAAAVARRSQIQHSTHIDFLNATGQEIAAVQYKLELDKAALLEGVEDREKYNDTIAEMEATAQARIADITKNAGQGQEDALDDMKDAYAGLFDFMERGFSDALATMLLDGELTFKSLAESFLREFVQMGISKLVAQGFGALSSIFGGINPETGGANLAPGQTYGPVFTGPGAANGGHIGGPTLVGERGPELFIPSTSGFVANNNAMRQMSGSAASPINVTVVNNTGQESSTSEKDGSNGGRDIEVMIGKAITKNIARGGDVDQAIRSSYGVQRVGRHGL